MTTATETDDPGTATSASQSVTLNRTVLADALARAFAVAPSRTPRDVIKNVKVEVHPGEVTIQATDLEVALKTGFKVESQSSDGWSFLVSPTMFTAIRKATGENVVFTQTADGVTIESGFGIWDFVTADPDEFPSVEDVLGDPITVQRTALVKALNRTMFATDVQSTRYALGGVLFDVQSGSLTLAATDSRRLAVHEISAECDASSPFPESPVVPLKGAKSLISISGSDTVEIKATAVAVSFRCGDDIVWCRLLEGRFPRYADIIPENSAFTFHGKALAGPLRDAVEQASITTNSESIGVELAFGSGNLVLKGAGAEVGTSRITLPVECDGEFCCHLDPKYVCDFLRSTPQNSAIAIRAIDAVNAFVMRSDGSTYLTMPLVKEE